MRQLQNLTDDITQRHTIIFEESEIALTLRYHPTAQFWSVDLDYKDHTVKGHKLSLDVLHMASRNLPFDFLVRDSSGTGLDPYRRDDFATGRCRLYLLEPDNMEALRGAPVEV